MAELFYKKPAGLIQEHSRNVALAAKCIAQHASLETEEAFVFGLLYDIGRHEGVSAIKFRKQRNKNLAKHRVGGGCRNAPERFQGSLKRF
jgi:HD superfamily phosphohydrolase YqeK